MKSHFSEMGFYLSHTAMQSGIAANAPGACVEPAGAPALSLTYASRLPSNTGRRNVRSKRRTHPDAFRISSAARKSGSVANSAR